MPRFFIAPALEPQPTCLVWICHNFETTSSRMKIRIALSPVKKIFMEETLEMSTKNFCQETAHSSSFRGPFLPFESLTSSSPTTMGLSYALKRTVSIQRKKGLSRNAKLTFCEAELCLRSQYYLYLRVETDDQLDAYWHKKVYSKCDIKKKRCSSE